MTYKEFLRAIDCDKEDCDHCKAAQRLFQDMMQCGELKLAPEKPKSAAEQAVDELLRYSGEARIAIFKMGGLVASVSCTSAAADSIRNILVEAFHREISKASSKASEPALGSLRAKCVSVLRDLSNYFPPDGWGPWVRADVAEKQITAAIDKLASGPEIASPVAPMPDQGK